MIVNEFVTDSTSDKLWRDSRTALTLSSLRRWLDERVCIARKGVNPGKLHERLKNSKKLAVYVDTSGSMTPSYGVDRGLLESIVGNLGVPFYAFDTRVKPLHPSEFFAQLAEGTLCRGGGSDFSCAIGHAREKGYSEVLLITDGQGPSISDIFQGKAKEPKVFILLVGGGATVLPLGRDATALTILKPAPIGNAPAWGDIPNVEEPNEVNQKPESENT